MKLTPYKLARVKLYSKIFKDAFILTEEFDQIDKGDWSPDLTSRINKIANRVLPKRLKKTKGAFGKHKPFIK